MLPLRSGISRRVVPRRRLCWSCNVTDAGLARVAEVRAGVGQGEREMRPPSRVPSTLAPLRRAKLFGVALALLTVAVAAQAPKAPKFRHERSVEAPTGGPHRLAVDVTLLAGGKPF